jgi:hypothetical protein
VQSNQALAILRMNSLNSGTSMLWLGIYVDVSTSFEDEKELIMATLAQLETRQAEKDAAAKEDKKADSKM